MSQTLYKPAKHKYLAKIVSFKNPAQAKKSVIKLKKEFRTGKKAKKLRIARATQYASNRSKASLKKSGLSKKERSELNQISNIYGNAVKGMWKTYRSKYGTRRKKR